MNIATAPRWCEDWIGWEFVPGSEEQGRTDCWGLVCMVLEQRFGVARVPRYGMSRARVRPECVDAALAVDGCPWSRVRDGVLRPGDVAAFDLGQFHVGVVVSDHWMLHTRPGQGSHCTRIDRDPYRGGLIGVYRHEELVP